MDKTLTPEVLAFLNKPIFRESATWKAEIDEYDVVHLTGSEGGYMAMSMELFEELRKDKPHE